MKRRGWLAACALMGLVTPVAARPTYFATLRTFFAIPTDSRIDACGVCHKRWTGTGARNLFGVAVEQQIYTGRSIADALEEIDGLDSDGDGFTNADELITYLTLPGYNCDNFRDAVGAPIDYPTFVTPLVATCLPPLDLDLQPAALAFLTEVGKADTLAVTISNIGSTDTVVVSDYGLTTGTASSLQVDGPALPVQIPVGGAATFEITFTPSSASAALGALHVSTNDPDPEQAEIDVPISAFGFVKNLAPPDVRASCRQSMARAFARYTKVLVAEWVRCGVEEGQGIACRRGRRDRRIAQALRKLRDQVGGRKDRACAGRNLVPTQLDYPATCAPPCDGIGVSNYDSMRSCFVCRGDAAAHTLVDALVGAMPPDTPTTVAANRSAAQCLARSAMQVAGAVRDVGTILTDCEDAAIESETTTDCVASEAAAIAAVTDDVTATVAGCSDATGLGGCAWAPVDDMTPADPTCLATVSSAVAQTLIDAVYDRAD